MKISYADIITMANAFCGFLSIYFSITFQFTLSFLAIIMGAIFDALDGFVSRLLKQESDLTAFDSIADTVSFVVAPPILLFQANFVSGFFGYILLSFYLLAGITRLARYEKIKKESKYFDGMPTAAAAAFLASVIASGIAFSPEINVLLLIIVSFLMVCGINYPRMRQIKSRLFFFFVVLGALTLPIFGLSNLLFIPFLSYVVIGPFLIFFNLEEKIIPATLLSILLIYILYLFLGVYIIPIFVVLSPLLAYLFKPRFSLKG